MARRSREEGWVVLTRDHRIRYNKVERESLFAANVQCFTLTSSGVTGEEAGAATNSVGRLRGPCAREWRARRHKYPEE